MMQISKDGVKIRLTASKESKKTIYRDLQMQMIKRFKKAGVDGATKFVCRECNGYGQFLLTHLDTMTTTTCIRCGGCGWLDWIENARGMKNDEA